MSASSNDDPTFCHRFFPFHPQTSPNKAPAKADRNPEKSGLRREGVAFSASSTPPSVGLAICVGGAEERCCLRFADGGSIMVGKGSSEGFTRGVLFFLVGFIILVCVFFVFILVYLFWFGVRLAVV